MHKYLETDGVLHLRETERRPWLIGMTMVLVETSRRGRAVLEFIELVNCVKEHCLCYKNQ